MHMSSSNEKLLLQTYHYHKANMAAPRWFKLKTKHFVFGPLTQISIKNPKLGYREPLGNCSSAKIPLNCGLRLCSHLVQELGARVLFSLGTKVNTPFFEVVTPVFGHSALARAQGLDRVLGASMLLGPLEYSVTERSTILCRSPGTSAQAPGVNTA